VVLVRYVRVAAIAGWRGRPRLRRGANQLQLSVIVCGRASSSRGLVPTCGPSDRQIGATPLSRWISGATINIRGQRFEPSCGCPDPGALTMLDQPSNQSQDISLPAAE
jgi:hypothetical protein